MPGAGDGGRGGQDGEADPTRPETELLVDLIEAVAFVRTFLEERGASLDHIISQTGFARNAAILAAKEAAIEQRLQRLMEQNPLRTDFQRHYEQIVADYNREKDRVTIEKTFEALFQFNDGLNEEDRRAMREGLDEESLAIFELLKKGELSPFDIKRIKAVSVELLEELKAEKLKVDHWREKEATRDAVRVAIRNFLWSDETGLPVDSYDEVEVNNKAEEVFVHVFRAYPTVPSPYYAAAL